MGRMKHAMTQHARAAAWRRTGSLFEYSRALLACIEGPKVPPCSPCRLPGCAQDGTRAFTSILPGCGPAAGYPSTLLLLNGTTLEVLQVPPPPL